jgi:hypothetical protein
MNLDRFECLAWAVTIYSKHPKAASRAIAALALLAIIAPAIAQDIAPYKVADGLAVYLGVIPGELITGHPWAILKQKCMEEFLQAGTFITSWSPFSTAPVESE